MGISAQNLLIILVIALVIFGAGKLPQIGEGLGKAIRNFKQSANEDDEEAKKKVEQDDKDDKNV